MTETGPSRNIDKFGIVYSFDSHAYALSSSLREDNPVPKSQVEIVI